MNIPLLISSFLFLFLNNMFFFSHKKDSKNIIILEMVKKKKNLSPNYSFDFISVRDFFL